MVLFKNKCIFFYMYILLNFTDSLAEELIPIFNRIETQLKRFECVAMVVKLSKRTKNVPVFFPIVFFNCMCSSDDSILLVM